MKRRSELWLLFGLLLLSGCGAWQPEVSSPMRGSDEALFDGRQDQVEDPAVLPEAFAEAYAGRLEGLVERSDLIALVVIERWRGDLGPAGVRRVSLAARVVELLEGEAGERLSLSRREGEPGYDALAEGPGALEGAEALLFVKWAQAGAGAPVEARFHLSPASPAARAAVEEALDAR